ncbi:MAG: hypothetical protein LBR65_08975 [Culturomica sp.]|jgi:hypothetical protein|nr:hypothetical protein [Culturomica sp.]
MKKQNLSNQIILLWQGLFFIIATILLAACVLPKTMPITDTSISVINIIPEKTTNYTNPSLKKFITENEGASVVVRDNKAAIGSGVSGNSRSSNLCLLLESALLKAHYNVRDRQIFENVMDKMSDNVDYEQLSIKTGTDLIFEVIDFDTDEYNVDKYYKYSPQNYTKYISNHTDYIGNLTATEKFYDRSIPRKGYDKKGYELRYSSGRYYNNKGKVVIPVNYGPYTPTSYNFTGYHIEIKVIMLRDNKVGGTYRYYYTPCDVNKGGCKISSFGPPALHYLDNNDNKYYDKSPDRKVDEEEALLKELSNFISKIVVPDMDKEMKGVK